MQAKSVRSRRCTPWINCLLLTGDLVNLQLIWILTMFCQQSRRLPTDATQWPAPIRRLTRGEQKETDWIAQCFICENGVNETHWLPSGWRQFLAFRRVMKRDSESDREWCTSGWCTESLARTETNRLAIVCVCHYLQLSNGMQNVRNSQ